MVEQSQKQSSTSNATISAISSSSSSSAIPSSNEQSKQKQQEQPPAAIAEQEEAEQESSLANTNANSDAEHSAEVPIPIVPSTSVPSRLGRFHIQPFREALGGLSSLFGRGKTKALVEEKEAKEELGEKGKNVEKEENEEEAKEDVKMSKQIESKSTSLEEAPVAAASGKNDSKKEEEEKEGEKEDEQIEDAEILQPIQILPSNERAEKSEEKVGTSTGIPEPKPRRRMRRGSSIVHPIDAAAAAANTQMGQQQQLQEGQQTKLAIRPRSLSARKLQKPLEPSRESPWIYVQMPDRTFKRITESELEQQTKSGKWPSGAGANQQIGNAGHLATILPAEFASISMAISIQSAFQALALLIQGFLSGLTSAHAFFVLIFPRNPSSSSASSTADDLEWLVQFYGPLAIPIQTFFYVCLTIGLVDAMDRFVLPQFSSSFFQFIWHSVFSMDFVLLLCWFGTFIASISCAQVDEYFAKGNWQIIKKDNWLLLNFWRWASVTRAVFALFGWLLIAQNPSKNAIREELQSKMPRRRPKVEEGGQRTGMDGEKEMGMNNA